ncbi:MAG: dihydrolipoyl dehydrogenase [Nitrososphaerota archaeon]
MDEADCAVIGGGPGGYVCAIRLAQLGKKIILVEKGELGGECTNMGCIPSKHLISYANKVDHMRRLLSAGLAEGTVKPLMGMVTQSSVQIIRKLRQGIAFLLNSYGVKVVKGQADVLEPGLIEVRGGGNKRFRVGSIVIATGSEAAGLPTMPTDGRKLINYEKALFLDALPDSMLVVGGGAVGLELGTAFAKLGVKVAVVEVMDQLLPGFDREASRAVRRSLEKMGVDIHLKTTVSQYSYRDGDVEVTLSNSSKYLVNYVLLAVGKKPTEWCRRLREIGVELDEKGFIKTDSGMRTNVENIYAVGDVTGPPFLAHRASRQGIVAAENIAGLEARFDNKSIPYGVFTDPEVAATGLSEDEARSRGENFRTVRFPISSMGRALADREVEGFTKVIFDGDTGVVYGIVVVGPHATEIAAEASLAVEKGLTLSELAYTIHIHPTYSESILEASHVGMRRGIHYVSR